MPFGEILLKIAWIYSTLFRRIFGNSRFRKGTVCLNQLDNSKYKKLTQKNQQIRIVILHFEKAHQQLNLDSFWHVTFLICDFITQMVENVPIFSILWLDILQRDEKHQMIRGSVIGLDYCVFQTVQRFWVQKSKIEPHMPGESHEPMIWVTSHLA